VHLLLTPGQPALQVLQKYSQPQISHEASMSSHKGMEGSRLERWPPGKCIPGEPPSVLNNCTLLQRAPCTFYTPTLSVSQREEGGRQGE
jgi:hypothetical protein